MINEHKKGFKAKKYPEKTKPAAVGDRNPVAKNSKMAGKSGAHKNPKDATTQPRKAKHKKAEMMETVISVIGEASHPLGKAKQNFEMRCDTPEKLAQYFQSLANQKGKSVEELARSKAWSYGYGKMSDHYWRQIADLIDTSPSWGVDEPTDESGDMMSFFKDLQKTDPKFKNLRVHGDPEHDELRRQDQEKRDAERASANQRAKDAIAQDVANLPELEAEYEKMLARYKSLGGSGWQYADREQNLTSAEREARGMEHGLRNLHSRISAAKKQNIEEAWSQKYKKSINCSHPKGFSQKAHCAGKKKHNESMMTMEAVCPDCGMCQTHGNLNEIKKGQKDSNGFTKCWPGKHAEGTKKGKNGGQVRNCKPNESQGVAEGAPIVVMPSHKRLEKKHKPSLSRGMDPAKAQGEQDARDGKPYNNPYPFKKELGAPGNWEHNSYKASYDSVKQGVAEGLNEFAPDGFNGGDDGEEFNPRMAKMAYDEGVVKGVSLSDGATTQRAMAINDWDKHDGGIYSQHFAKGFKAGRLDKIRHNNKQYNLNLKLMKDGSIRHGEQGVAEGWFDNQTSDAENDAKVAGRRNFLKVVGTGLAGAGLAAAGLGASQNAQAGDAPEIKMQDARHGTVAYQGKNIPITLNDTTRAMGTLAKAKLNGQTVDIHISLDGARAWIPPSAMPHMGESMMAGGILAEDIMGLGDNEFEPKQHHDPEGNMARSELYRNAKYALDLLKMIEPDDEIEPWVAANLTNAATWLDKVYHYLDYRTKFEPEMDMKKDDKDIKESEAEPSGDIARMNLQEIMEYSTKLFKMIKPETRLDGWVAMKLTKASEAVSSSKHYLEHQYFEKHSSDMYESKILKKFSRVLSKNENQ